MSDDSDDTELAGGATPAGGISRPLLAVGLLLALGATVALVFSDSVRWLRLGVIAALWAALAGAFIAAKFRRDAGARDDEIDNLHNVYELELEREVAARREHELEFEAEVAQKAQTATSEQLSALRGELNTLRQHLETLLGGELLVERVALHAESTRMRSIPENPHQQARAEAQPKVRRPANEIPAERRRPAAQLGSADQERTMRAEPVLAPSEPVRRPQPAISQDTTSAALWPSRQRNGVRHEDVDVPVASNGNGRYLPGEPFAANGSSANGNGQNGHGVNGNGATRNGNRPGGEEHAPVIDPNWTPSWESDSQRLRSQAEQAQPRGSQRLREPEPARASQRLREPEPARGSQRLEPEAPRIREPEPVRETPPRRPAAFEQPIQPPPTTTFEPAAFEPEPEPRPAAKTQQWRPEPEPEPTPEPPAPAEPAGGRRRRPENVSFTESFGTEQSSGRHGGGQSGSHARPQPARAGNHAQPATSSHRKEPVVEQDSGAHANGRAVSDLLAANGKTDTPRRRRRRED